MYAMYFISEFAPGDRGWSGGPERLDGQGLPGQQRQEKERPHHPGRPGRQVPAQADRQEGVESRHQEVQVRLAVGAAHIGVASGEAHLLVGQNRRAAGGQAIHAHIQR